MAKEKKITSYQKAMEELQQIAEMMQDEIVSIDDMAEKAKRAAALIAYCRQKLRATEKEIDGVFDEN